MTRASRRLLALAYAAAAAMRATLSSPRWALDALRRARRIVRSSGWRSLERFVLDDFLPRHFRVATQVRLGGPSSAVYRKFAGIVRTPPIEPVATPPWGLLRAPARILVIRAGAMGDVLLATPIVRKLYNDREGHALIDVVTKHPEVFRGNPAVHQVIAPKDLAREVRSHDLIVNLDGVYERNPACHVIDAYAFHAFGRIDFDKQPELFATADEKRRVDTAIEQIGRPYLVVHKPDHHWPNRNLPMSMWQAMIESLLQGWSHAIVQIGGPSDAAVSGNERLLDHRQRYSLQELRELIAGSAGFVGVDAGPVHVASCTDAPMFVFFTSAHHDFRKPLREGGVFVPLTPRIECYGCQASNPPPGTAYYCRRGDNACVDSFDGMAAAQTILDTLAGRSRPAPIYINTMS